MYLLYDVLQLRKSSLGNTFLIKRQHWKDTSDDIASLTLEKLQDAASQIAAGQNIEDPLIRRLQRNIVTIGLHVPGSFAQKLIMRSEIRGIIVRYGMPAFWMTINPSDLQSPLVLTLAGCPLSEEDSAASNSAIRRAVATSNPVAVAEFFHHVCEAVLHGLLSGNDDTEGVLGDISNYFGVVESNGRGMLHLHALLWVRGNLAFANLRDRLLNDTEFSARLIRYLERIIIQSIDQAIQDDAETNPPSNPPSAKESESDDSFLTRLHYDSNAVARKKQMHSRQHLATCFKYRQSGAGKNICRFGMPRALVPLSMVDELGIIHLARNHPWVNPWNPAIASCVRSNQDISWIPTVSKSLSLIYYITNYATKDDVSPWQIVAKAALLKQTIEKAKAADPPTAADLRLQGKGMDKFALRCFNTLAHDREVSGVQVASTLLQLPTHYTVNYNFVCVNLWWLRRYVRSIIQPSSANSLDSNPMGDEPCAYETGGTAPASIFDNYRWRGPLLAPLCLFEYCMLVRTRNLRDAMLDDVNFEPEHPRYATHVQRLARMHSQVSTVTFNGQLSECQVAEDAVPGGHPKTEAIVNDLAELLLGLFVPWKHISPLFIRYATQINPCMQVWTTVEPTLAPHIRDYARNIELLRKSKEDCQADAKSRTSANHHASHLFDNDVEDTALADIASDAEEHTQDFCHQNESFNAETLIAAYHSISKIWQRQATIVARRIPSLLTGITPSRTSLFQNLRPLDIFHSVEYETSGLRSLPQSKLQDWELSLKGLAKSDNNENTARASIAAEYEMGDFNETEDAVLQPLLTTSDLCPIRDDHRSRIGHSPTGASLTSIISESIPMNHKQQMVVRKVLSQALAWDNSDNSSSRRTQTRLCVMGEGGTGKSQVIKAIVAGMDLIDRKHEVILMAPTGAAADNIGGNTYHTSLGISIDRSRTASSTTTRIKRLWARKTIMIVDEISMMDLTMISLIDNHCKIAKSHDRNSIDFFGGLPIIIFIGDFFQFPPVSGPALWKEPRSNKDEDQKGQLLWHQFKQVIILDEQMRQSEDAPFRALLSRARSGSLTGNDLSVLNSKAIISLISPQLEGATIIVKLNSLRHQLNRIQMENFARFRHQRIFIFPALHTRTRSTSPSNLRLHADDLLQQPDQGTKIPFPGLFLYTLGMPAMILSNICTLLGQVNGATGAATGIVVDPTGTLLSVHASKQT